MEVPLDEASEGEGPPLVAAASGPGVALASYYDRLASWTAAAAYLGYGGGRHLLTVHRALADPKAGGAPTPQRLHDVLLATLGAAPSGHVLDAGCGLGGTMLDLAGRSSARFTGLTLSARQAAIARSAIAKAGFASRVGIHVGSYDAPPKGPFDLVLAIESLAHSLHPTASVAALAARLPPGGRFAIADDLPEAAARGTSDLGLFQAGWHAPVLAGAAELAAALVRCGLVIVADRDLTGELRPRPLERIARLEAANRLLRRLAPAPASKTLLDSYLGGLALERLYRSSLMRYRLIVAERPR